MELFQPVEEEVTPDKPEWKQLELLVAAIQQKLAPNATVTHNAKLPGALTETMRQIDVLVEEQIGQYTMRIIIDCKDYKTKVDVKGVEEFYGMIKDVGANKGALVCPAGFSKNAKILAQKRHIDLYRPADTNPHKWQVRLALPVLCDFRATTISFKISGSSPGPLRLPEVFYTMPVFGADSQPLGSFLDVATQQWEDGNLPTEPGEHQEVDVFGGEETQIDNGYGDLCTVKLTVFLNVTRELYVGHLPIEELSGLRDEQTGMVITNAFKTGALDPNQVQQTWTKIADGDPLPFKPVLTARGLISWGPPPEERPQMNRQQRRHGFPGRKT